MDEQASSAQTGDGGTIGFFEMLADSPVALRDYLTSEDITRRRDQTYTRFGLSEKERAAALFAELDLFFDQIDLADFPARLAEAVPERAKDAEKMRMLTAEVLGRIVLPAEAFIGDVAALVREYGADPAAFPSPPLVVRAVTYGDGAKDIVSHVALEGLTQDQERRLLNAVESRLRNVRTDNDLVDLLTRSRKTGGVELALVDARRIVDEIGARVKLMKFEEGTAPSVAPAAPSAQASAPTPAPASPSPTVAPATAAEVLRAYAGSTEEQLEIAKRVERIRKVTGNDSAKMRDAFYEVLYPEDVAPENLKPVDPLYVVAGLIAAAEDAELEDLLSEDERYRELVRMYYETPAGAARAEEAAQFASDAMNTAAMNVLLQLLLRGFARLSDGDSARFAVRITNALKRTGIPRLQWLAAYDMRAGGFRWTDPITLG